jgi:hypothetical protein
MNADFDALIKFSLAAHHDRHGDSRGSAQLINELVQKGVGAPGITIPNQTAETRT